MALSRAEANRAVKAFGISAPAKVGKSTSKFAKLTLVGDKEILKRLKKIPAKLSQKVVGKAGRAAMRPAITSARRKLLSQDLEGKGVEQLRKSLRAVVRRHPQQGTIITTMGAMANKFRYAKKGTKTGQGDPANFAHLVEFGHRIVTGGRATRSRGGKTTQGAGAAKGFVRGRPFMRPAFDEKKAAMRTAFNKKALKELDSEVKKLGGK